MRYLKQIIDLFYPRICACCDGPLVKNENDLCLKCRSDLAITQFASEKGNKVEQIFYGRITVEFATALLFYREREKTQQLIYKIKYKGRQHLGKFVGQWMGAELKSVDRFPDIELIIPVPLHKIKLRQRGYNQLTVFGKTLAEILGVDYVEKTLKRRYVSGSQTFKQRFERFKNVKETFFIDGAEHLIGKHVLLIDDVITTGATLEACASVLNEIKDIKISIACMAYTE